MTLKEINDCYEYSSLYEGDEFQPRTFLRYREYIEETFPCYIDFNQRTGKYEFHRHQALYGEDDSLYDYLLSAYHIEGMTELALKHRDKIMLTEAPTGVEFVQIILEAIDKKRGIECDYYSYNKKSVKQQKLIPYFLRTWENRWYLVAEPDNHHRGQSVFALERMALASAISRLKSMEPRRSSLFSINWSKRSAASPVSTGTAAIDNAIVLSLSIVYYSAAKLRISEQSTKEFCLFLSLHYSRPLLRGSKCFVQFVILFNASSVVS